MRKELKIGRLKEKIRMRINISIIRWLHTKEDLLDVPEKTLKKIREFLQDIEEAFKIKMVLNSSKFISASVPLYPENCKPSQKVRICKERKEFLTNFEQEEKILKINRPEELTTEMDFITVRVDIKKFNEFYEKIQERVVEEDSVAQLSEVKKWFNHKNNSLIFYDKLYKPRKGIQGKIIRNLVMRHQEENTSGKILKPGEKIREEELAIIVGSTIHKLSEVRKQLKRTFKERGFPLKIDLDSEGILLIRTK